MVDIKTANWKIKDVEAILFDKDGTIIDSHIYWGGIIERRSEALIKRLGLSPSYHEKLCMVMGFSLKTRKLLPEGPIALVSREKVIGIVCEYLRKEKIDISDEEIGAIFTEVHSVFINEIYNYTRILPGLKELAAKLKSKNIKMAIITTDIVENTEKIIQFLGIRSYFNLLVGRETTDQPKATGTPALMAVESLRVSAKNTVAIGDAQMDMVMAKKADLKAGIGVTLGQISRNELLKETAYVIDGYDELNII